MSKTMMCWPLFGTGLESLGCDRQPCQREVPTPASDQLLVRIDAIGLCFSDIKMIRAGEEHPRVYSKDLAEHPVIPGHEAVMTVVQAGSGELAAAYPPGSRYIIQADIYVGGVGFAYGYAIDGGMAQYSIVDQRVLNGDEGSYLLPLADHVPAAVAALVEPWTCVIASYMIEPRQQVAAGGRMLVAMPPGERREYTFSAPSAAHQSPATIDCLEASQATMDNLRAAFPTAEMRVLPQPPEESAYDDIVLCGAFEQGLGERLTRLGRQDAVISFVGAAATGRWAFDVGSIHYRGWFYQGAPGLDMAAAYGRNTRSKPRPNGTCWLLGGAGAMGQMHTQLAVENEDGPRRVLVTDLDDRRIAKVEQQMAAAIERRGIEFRTLNPKNFPDEAAFLQAVREFAPDGFDDIVMLVPVVPVLNSAVDFLAEDGVMNIFAGIPVGQEAKLAVEAIANRGVRYIGSSGSRTYHLRHTLKLAESGALRPVTALAAVGGMRALWEGLEGVAEGRFPGKTVIFPQCEDLPLTPVERLRELAPEVAEALGETGEYNGEVEQAIMRKFGKPAEQG